MVGIVNMVGMANLLLVLRAVNGLADISQLFGGRALRRERLHDELARGPAEGALEQVADELPLRRFFAETRTIDVRTVALVALDQTLLGHDLEQLERRGVRCL